MLLLYIRKYLCFKKLQSLKGNCCNVISSSFSWFSSFPHPSPHHSTSFCISLTPLGSSFLPPSPWFKCCFLSNLPAHCKHCMSSRKCKYKYSTLKFGGVASPLQGSRFLRLLSLWSMPGFPSGSPVSSCIPKNMVCGGLVARGHITKIDFLHNVICLVTMTIIIKILTGISPNNNS